MKKSFEKIYLIMVIVFLINIMTICVKASSIDYAITHGMQDALLLGEVTQIADNGNVTIKVAILFNETSRAKEISDSLEIKAFSYEVYGTNFIEEPQADGSVRMIPIEGQEAETPNIGDFVFLSLDKNENGIYSVINGAYRVDSLGTQTLRFYTWSENSNTDLALYTYFIQNGGKVIDYYGKGSNYYLYSELHQAHDDDKRIDIENKKYAPLLFPQAAEKRSLPVGTLATTQAIQKVESNSTNASSMEVSQNTIEENSISDALERNQETKNENKPSRSLMFIGIAAALFIALFIALKSRSK